MPVTRHKKRRRAGQRGHHVLVALLVSPVVPCWNPPVPTGVAEHSWALPLIAGDRRN